MYQFLQRKINCRILLILSRNDDYYETPLLIRKIKDFTGYIFLAEHSVYYDLSMSLRTGVMNSFLSKVTFMTSKRAMKTFKVIF